MINRYSNLLKSNFDLNNNTFEEINKTPQTIEIENIYRVWSNFFKKQYAGKGFIFFIFGAALIDFLGFILYHLATTKKN